MKNGAELIFEERQRQIEQEGWSAEHDDNSHKARDLLRAADCYLHSGINGSIGKYSTSHCTKKVSVPIEWPFEPKSWKPKTVIHDLVRAGALIAAEIDRLQRMDGRTHEELERQNAH